MERIVKGIWIPIEIWEAEGLSWTEKILLAEIDSYTTEGRDYCFSDEENAQLLNVSVRTASRLLTTLIDKGYVVRTRFDGRRRFVVSAMSKMAELLRQKWRTCSDSTTTKESTTYTEVLLPAKDNKGVGNNIKEEKEYKEKEDFLAQFTSFVKLYRKLTGRRTRSVETEFADFKARHPNWKKVLPYLSVAIERETKARNQAKSMHQFFPEPKMLQTYLGRKKAWEEYVTIGDDIQEMKEAYLPACEGSLMWDESNSCYMYIGFWSGYIADGYTDDNRPDGATVVLNNGRGTVVWNASTKQWDKK